MLIDEIELVRSGQVNMPGVWNCWPSAEVDRSSKSPTSAEPYPAQTVHVGGCDEPRVR
ncbi:hypothetical protein LIPSTDRAFT_69854 [Lipomyces starkeyi NRRL Y-11557]|uniref:Uncharacterized protein n=1 Tax=Lipomyces starkeyi NRRL Y-11557 TaxID=675824 RepID=A0A1E3QB82_LIPST|nr:hypothetical protein LIPSTDRAFT_69854 [Lipomyces starkeyi NRRL Y-11557]